MRIRSGRLPGWAATLGVTALLAGIGRLHAQAVVKGRVVADSTHLPLVGADVQIPELGRSTFTTTDGTFRLDSIPLGLYTLRVRRIGFLPGVATLRVESADSLVVVLPLPALIPTLEPLLAQAKAVRSRETEIADRHRIGGGRLIPYETIRQREYLRLPELLETTGVRFLTLGAQRIPVSPRVKRLSTTGATACPMSVLLNGIEVPQDLSQIPVAALGTIEVFKSPGETPVEYSGINRSCGVILLWTRDR